MNKWLCGLIKCGCIVCTVSIVGIYDKSEIGKRGYISLINKHA